MSTVCFTGRGYDQNGTFQTRDLWESMARQMGWSPVPTVEYNTGYLVASRSDTTKARSAQRNGVRVLTYSQFHDMWRQRTRGGAQQARESYQFRGECRDCGSVRGITPGEVVCNPCVDALRASLERGEVRYTDTIRGGTGGWIVGGIPTRSFMTRTDANIAAERLREADEAEARHRIANPYSHQYHPPQPSAPVAMTTARRRPINLEG